MWLHVLTCAGTKALEGDVKKLKAKLKERSDAIKSLSDLAEKRAEEVQARGREVRGLTLEVAELKRRLSEKAGTDRDKAIKRQEQEEGELRDVKALLADREAALQVALQRAERVPTLEKELSTVRAKIVPTSLADMADMTPRASMRLPRPESQHRAGSAGRVVRPRSKAGEKRVNEGFLILGDVKGMGQSLRHDESLVSDQVNISGSLDGSIVDDIVVGLDYGNDSFETQEV